MTTPELLHESPT